MRIDFGSRTGKEQVPLKSLQIETPRFFRFPVECARKPATEFFTIVIDLTYRVQMVEGLAGELSK